KEEMDLTLPTKNVREPQEIKETVTYDLHITPRKAQQEALQALEATVAEEYDKAMVVMATGLGKTYLAAFFAKKFKKILFIAIREEILKQSNYNIEIVLSKEGDLYYGV